MKPLKFISRLDYRNVHGYNVRILYPDMILRAKLFSDLKWNGKDNALKKAIAYRNKILKKYKLEYKLEMPCNCIGPRNRYKSSTSGVVGVALAKKVMPQGDYYCWTGSWWDHQKQTIKSKSYGVLLHGECSAFQQACYARFKKCGTLYVYKDRAKYNTPCKIPCWVGYEYII